MKILQINKNQILKNEIYDGSIQFANEQLISLIKEKFKSDRMLFN